MTNGPPEWIEDYYDGDVPSITEDPDGPLAIEGVGMDDHDRLMELAGCVDETPLGDIFDTAAEKAAEAMAERMEYELRGAWRAGYDRLDVYDEIYGMGGFDPDLTITQYVHPAHEGDPRPSPDGLVYRHSYDLTSVDDETIMDAIG